MPKGTQEAIVSNRTFPGTLSHRGNQRLAITEIGNPATVYGRKSIPELGVA
jgi:hypothetical protein